MELTPFREEELWRAEELFLTSTTMDVMPVVAVDDRPAGGGRPGPITTRLYEGVRERLYGGAVRSKA